jgi:hypothetical protein
LWACRPAVLYFWYRQSPAYLIPASQGGVTADDPPLVVPMMARIFLDTKGNLVEFQAVASGAGSSGDSPFSTDWKALFDAAGLDIASFRPINSDWISPVNSEAHATWEGSYPDQPSTKIRVRAAAYRDRPVYFRIFGPWTDISDRKVQYTPSGRRAGFQPGAQSRFFFTFSFIVFAVASLMCALLARRNLRIGRGDRRGAFRLALCIFAARLLAWLFQTHHVPALGEMELFYTAVAWALFYAGVSWLLYIALEPYVRRNWPLRIISWSRLLAGGIRDPLVGRDILLGTLFGTSSTLLAAYMYLAIPRLGFPPDRPPSVALATLLGAREVFGQILAMQREILTDPLYVLVVLLLLTAALRKEWLAFGAAWLLFSVVGGSLFGVQLAANLAVVSVVVAIYLLVLGRFGLLATIVFQFYTYLLLNCPLTFDFYAWYASGTILALLVAISLAFYAYYISLAGQPVFRSGFLRD